MATIQMITHYCTDHDCCGEILETHENGIKLVRKAFLMVDGKSVFSGSESQARDYAVAHNLEIPE